MNGDGKRDNSRGRHQANLSINSISSLVEPTTPPSYGRVLSWEGHGSIDVSKDLGAMGYAPGTTNGTNRGLLLNGAGMGNYSNNSIASSMSNSSMGSMVSSGSLLSLGAPGSINTQAPGGGSESKMDKEYLASLNKVPLSKLSPEIIKLSKDQYGCRFLQKKLDEHVILNFEARHENYEIIFKNVYPQIYELIIDPFGNYLVQKLIDYSSETDLNLVLVLLQYNLFQISINQHGTRALQKIISNLTTDYQLGILIKGLEPFIIELIKDLNGNHVIQKILNKYPPEKCQFIYDAIIRDLYVVATHKHGCCVLQKCLNHVNEFQLLQFSQTILAFPVFRKLIDDQYGNYVLQYLISLNLLSINTRVFEDLVTCGISQLCTLKFSSNVVERFLKNCYVNERKDVLFSGLKYKLILGILQEDLNKLVNDPYGNYVIQTLIDVLMNPSINLVDDAAEYLLLLLPPDTNLVGLKQQSIQIAIIKNWFTTCKIVSSYGKRIQLKINGILNGCILSSSTSFNSAKNLNQQNMNANGEFITSNHAPSYASRFQNSLRQNLFPANALKSNVQRKSPYMCQNNVCESFYPRMKNYAFENKADAKTFDNRIGNAYNNENGFECSRHSNVRRAYNDPVFQMTSNYDNNLNVQVLNDTRGNINVSEINRGLDDLLIDKFRYNRS